MPERPDLPEVLRQRLNRQRSRSRLVLLSFGLTFISTLAVFFALAGTLGYTGGNRVLYAHPRTADVMWLVDQRLPLQGQVGPGAFRLFEFAGDKVASGASIDGLAMGAGIGPDGTLDICTSSRLLRFAREGEGWKLAETVSLGLNDPTASPAVALVDGTEWLLWARGPELVVRPLAELDTPGIVAFKAAAPIQRIVAKAAAGAIWASVRESRGHEVHVLALSPARGTDGSLSVKVLRKTRTPAPSARISIAVLGEDAATAVPVLAMARQEDSTTAATAWTVSALVASDKPEGEWQQLAALPIKAAMVSEATGFVTVAADGNRLHAWFADGSKVMHASGDWSGPASFQWGEPAPVPLTEGSSEVAQMAWAGVLFVLALALMAQGVYLVLNRERPQDKAITALLKRSGKAGSPENKHVYASGPARAFALFIDLALTCPVVVLLRSVYEYRWEDAYGFIVFVGFGEVQADIVSTLVASLVTLSVLVIYSLFCEMMWGRTLGKALFRLRVVDLQGETPAPWRLVVRNLLKIVELAHWTVIMVPLGAMLFSGRQQRVGDILGGTLVVVDVVPEESTDDLDI